ncbi:DUF202 domain-containing protein [Streptomyces ipomoeae]|uniref:DUF202 domain-containing protein n=1 Tax=Streptomyces ipomoeae TaxID=103232 RepID=UPI0011470DE3|nr:DUF202 domain-containing protein [Streptomyces ipomoeae]MDX2823026.1 DUF202 domain-containing protein [Streptomyces ipomoeae]MDX2875714.1 DUF202 domain-containing protein [Streptomyces ipomoeae]MDX2932095.1 DUF202 domain-containing protein [Streptomyces ipomoeae]TQE23302.1 DUF202 domain-containing protein [Streptomyces ipomoeae]
MTPRHRTVERDPGLQPERTRLAWRRTTLTGAVIAVLAAKSALHDGSPASGVVAAALCAALWLGFLGLAHRRIGALARRRPTALSPRVAAAAALCTIALAVCGAALVF